MTTTDAATTRALYENLGHGILALAGPPPGDPEGEFYVGPDQLAETAAKELALGKQIDALIGTVVKAVLEGRQTNAQIRAKQQAARQAFARALARKVAKL